MFSSNSLSQEVSSQSSSILNNVSQSMFPKETKVLCLQVLCLTYVRRLSKKLEKVSAPLGLGVKAVFMPSTT